MRNMLSKREWKGSLPQPQLEAVWYVDADRTYSVNRRIRMRTGCVAVRTITGMGRLELHCGETFSLAAGSLGVFGMDQIAHYSTVGDGWQFYWFEFVLDGAEEALLNRTANIALSAQERIELEQCFQSLSRNSACECMRAEALFCCLLTGWQLQASEAERDGLPIHDILTLLEKGRRGRIPVSELAREAGMCERSFRNAVWQATGTSPKAYMLKGEMTAAMELLRTTGMTVSEIAALFNYSSPFYFSRVFRRYYGVSPQQIRDGIRR